VVLPAADDRETSHDMASSEPMSCPADNPVNGYFATR